MLAITRVWPSGADFTTCNVPVLVLAPGRLRVTKDCPSRLPRPSAIEPRQEVGAAAGRERHDELDRSASDSSAPAPRAATTREEQQARAANSPQHGQRPSAFAITCSQRWFSSSYSSPRHRLARERGRRARHVPAAREEILLLPPIGVVADIVVVDLLDLGGVFGDEAVRLDEIGEHVAAGAVPADAPHDLVAALAHAAGAAHQAVDVRHLIGHVVERRPVAAREGDAVMVGAAAHEVHHEGRSRST